MLPTIMAVMAASAFQQPPAWPARVELICQIERVSYWRYQDGAWQPVPDVEPSSGQSEAFIIDTRSGTAQAGDQELVVEIGYSALRMTAPLDAGGSADAQLSFSYLAPPDAESGPLVVAHTYAGMGVGGDAGVSLGSCRRAEEH